MSSASGGGLKIVRQPFVVDRIRVHELKEPSSLGLVYLNEYGTATAALVLSASEPKVAKVSLSLFYRWHLFQCRHIGIKQSPNYDRVKSPIKFKFLFFYV